MSLFNIFDIASSALTAQTERLNTTASNIGRFSYVNYDLDGDGVVTNNKKVMTYAFSSSQTQRPGVIAKLTVFAPGVLASVPTSVRVATLRSTSCRPNARSHVISVRPTMAAERPGMPV